MGGVRKSRQTEPMALTKSTSNTLDMACPIDARYYGADTQFFERLKPYVSERAYIAYQARVEVALAQVLAENLRGVPERLAQEAEEAGKTLTAEEVYAEEKRIGHDVRALVNCIRDKVSEESRPFIHLGATSNDIKDTATALRFKELTRDILLADLIVLVETLIQIAREHAGTVQIGRTHGQHAEPITFGYSLANYVARLGDRIEFIERARKELRGKFSGAVGAYNAVSLISSGTDFETRLLELLGLMPEDRTPGSLASTQIVHPEPLTDLTHGVVSAFSVLANLADDIRHLHRSEIGEVQETFQEQHVGSSTMPHKVNPRNFEFVKSMWKEFMPRMVTVYMDQISEHQRDLTNSASSRFVPELFTAFIYSVNRMNSSLKRLRVFPEVMKRNLENTAYDEIVAEPLYMLLSSRGHPDGHSCARKLIAKARSEGVPLTKLIWQDQEISAYLRELSTEQLRILQEPHTYFGLSLEKTRAVCQHWETRLEKVRTRLRPS
jgi:adenylosuccinate lyase